MANIKYQLQNVRHRNGSSGFALVEYILVMAIFAILAGVTTINLANAQHSASLSTTVDVLVSDLREQQLKAMIGDTEGRATSDNYGIYFGTNSYTLFHGTYAQGGVGNFIVSPGDQIQFGTVTFPGSKIIFTAGSGEVSGFANGSNTIVVRDITNPNQKTITINRYGVITAVN